MVSIFPDKISRKAMTTYFIALVSVSVVFISHIMPFYMMLFGIVGVCAFFYFSTNLTKRWRTLHPKVFVKNLFWTALVVRLVYVVFVYFFYDAMTGRPFMFFSADEFVYFNSSKLWAESGFETFMNSLRHGGNLLYRIAVQGFWPLHPYGAYRPWRHECFDMRDDLSDREATFR